MKKYGYIILILCLHTAAYAQKGREKKADALFNKRSYVKAAELYEQIEPNQHVLQNLGDCYYNNSQVKDAARVYAKLMLEAKDSIYPEYYFRYAHALMGSGDYEKGDGIMAKYLKYNVNTLKFIANLKTNVPFNYEVQTMSKNTSNGDFGMVFYGDKVAFASLRAGEGKSYGWNERAYLDLFSADINAKGLLANIEPFPKEINTKTHESNPTFSQDGHIMYFNRTNDKMVKIGSEKIANIKIYKAEFVDGKWTNITALPFCSDQYSCEHPVLTKDGKRLYFSSDMPGSMGSFDLFYVDVKEDGTYSEPVNLGKAVNTIHREQFPEISNDGSTLYFASDGHQGMGGLDIFMSKSFQGGEFAKPINLGETLNSSMDDFSYVVDEKRNLGYFSSNRKGGDNLYSFTRTENQERYVVEGDVRDKNTQNLLPGTMVSLYDENNILIGQMVVGAEADYVFATEPNKKYRIEATRDFYIPHSEEFMTNEDGKLRYTIELFMECYDDAEEIITKRQDGRVEIVLENIYFDLNKWDIKPDAARILDVLVDLLKKYPEMEIELGAHTDSRASTTYNIMLSNRRAASTLEYLVDNGIKRRRLRSKGYGESRPLVNCGDTCTEQEHSINRRCEFIILK
ncbi:OmpA family protein [Flavobacterium sp. CYK-55]|uniref:OmpA family protein n=1 Tax=Flavobacterium sp. CYK-55 TaxID=2835529 RepID=UPI001BCF745E|nr:OmpA family protein [Flavobacterium sp. CYK-55]MBS7786214.1 OmpA family protein [Flavobacterium sp. CYK-55]